MQAIQRLNGVRRSHGVRSTDAGFFCFGDWAKFTLDVEL